jgi:hypothetical protein
MAQQQKLISRADRLKGLRDSYRAKVVEAGYVPGPEVWTLAIPELETRKSVLLSMIQATVSDFTEADLATKVWPIRELEAIAVKYFEFVNRTLPEGQPERYELLKSLVEALRDLLVRFGNKTMEWQATETFFELLLQYAPSDQIKGKITENIEMIASIKLDQAHGDSFSRLAKLSGGLDVLPETSVEELLARLDRYFEDVDEEVFYLERPRISDLSRLSDAKDSACLAAINLLWAASKVHGFHPGVYENGLRAERLASSPEAKLQAQGLLNELKYLN